MKTNFKSKLLSILLCFVMLVGLIPTTAFAWEAPTLSGGKAEWNVQLSDEGVLTWNDMGAASYDIEVDETEMGFTYTKIVGINTNSYNLIDRLKELKTENGTYYFTIKANALDISSGTIQFSYISPEPKLSAPLNLRWDGTVAKWDSVANATEYTVLLYSNSGNLQLSKTTTETQYDWSTNIYNDGFWFEVIATGDDYRNSNAAEGPKYGNYTWTAPSLTGGKAEWNVTISDDGMLKWNDMGSASYDIYVDETEMGGTVTNIYNVNTNTYNLINRLKDLKIENGIYYFHIKANDTDATSGDIRFMYISPETKLSAPLNLRWDGTVAKWDSVANATEYTVRLYSNSGNLQLSKTTSETQYDWSTNVYNEGFWFEVIATANDYRDSNASESPKYAVISYSIGAYPYDATVSKTQAGGQVYLITDEGTDGWSSDGYIKSATEGTTVTLNAMPATGYKFVEWRQGTEGAQISTSASLEFQASENKYLYAVFQAIETTEYQIELQIFDITYTATAGGTVKLESNKGSAEGTNPKAYATKGTAVTITAVPAQGYEFVAWKKYTPHYSTAFSTEATYTFTAEDPSVIPSDDPPLFLYAVFQEVQQIVPTYEINCVAHNLSSNEIGGKVFLETDKGGTGYAASQQKYATENTTVRLIAVAEPGYQFVGWRKGSPSYANATVSTNAEYEFTATEAVWMYAVFEYTPDCTIDCTVFDITGGINNGQGGVGGTVSIQTDKGSVEGVTPLPIKATRNSSVTVNAVAAPGYEFLGWKKSSPYVQDFVATTASYTFDINEELYLYAVFQEALASEYTVVYGVGEGNGSNDLDNVTAGTQLTLKTTESLGMSPIEGFTFDYWSIRVGTAQSAEVAKKQPGDTIIINDNTYIIAIWKEAPHVHSYDGTYKYDADEHWKQCSDPNCPDLEGSKTEYSFCVPQNATCATKGTCFCGNTLYGDCDFNSGVFVYYNEQYHVPKCKYCDKTTENYGEHVGGSATCTSAAECTNCNHTYGNTNASVHSGTSNWIKTADTHEKKYACCGATVVAEEAHEWSGGACTECEYACLHSLDNNKDHKCDKCEAAMGTHEAAAGKHTCDYCEKTVTECDDSNKDHKCDTCGAAMGTHAAATGKHTCDYCQKTVTECADTNSDGKCDTCGKKIGDCVDADKDHKCDKHGEAMGTHEAALGKHTCNYCEKTVTECEDSNKDHKCDTCGAAIGTHAAAAGKHTCDYCGKTVTECDDSDKDHKCDTCGAAMGTHEAAAGKHTCDYCGKTITECADANNDGKCDTCGEKIGDCVDADKDHKCDKHGETMGAHEAAAGKHTCDYCEKTVTECDDSNKDHKCDICVTKLSDCTDENKDHKCDTCGAAVSNHEAAAGKHTCDYCGAIVSECADENKDGKCDVCGKELTSHAHDYGTAWKSDETKHWNECSCGDKKNEAAHADENKDGKCDACEYQMSTAEPNPPVENPPVENPPVENPPVDNPPADDKDGLGVGAIVGIIIGCILVVGIGGFAIFWFVIKKKSLGDLLAKPKK